MKKLFVKITFKAFILASFCYLSGCTKTCHLQEVDPLHGGSMQYVANNRGNGLTRYHNLIKRLHHEGHCAVDGHLNGGNVNAFKLRFCNFMLGYRNDNREELIKMAKDIAENYKKMRMYDMARTFDSYRDVLLFGSETIAESWDDTMDLLEAFQAEIERKKKEEYCRKLKAYKDAQPSFWDKLFGKSKKQTTETKVQYVDQNNCKCTWDDSVIRKEDMVAIPNVIAEAPGGCSPSNPLLYQRSPQYDACFGTGGQACPTCPANGKTSAATVRNGSDSVDAAERFMK